uniref:WRKY domain-containing protein n=1 Tax=Oryza brachyantha TaxID=4533 RepID=J3M3N7_ORYBR
MTKMSSMRADGSVPKRRRQDVQKVVVSLKDHKVVQGPPADSWSWRKYGQKPIKGSPHPRYHQLALVPHTDTAMDVLVILQSFAFALVLACVMYITDNFYLLTYSLCGSYSASRGYYKCSSYRGCPARKQVDKCRNDASLLIITYTSDHNHDKYTATSSVQEQKHNPDSTDAGAVLSNGMALAEVTVASSKLNNEEESCDFFDELEELPVSASPLPSLSFMVQDSCFSDARTRLL